MKTFKSVDALKHAALKKGASASVGGEKFNSTADTMDAVRFPEPAPEPTPEPPKPEPIPAPVVEAPSVIVQADLSELSKTMDRFTESAMQMGQSNSRVLECIQQAIEKAMAIPPSVNTAPASEPKTSKGWLMTVERDVRGLMTQIVLNPK